LTIDPSEEREEPTQKEIDLLEEEDLEGIDIDIDIKEKDLHDLIIPAVITFPEREAKTEEEIQDKG